MIITLKGADFSGAGNNIGNLSQIGGTFTFTINPTPSDATVKINGTARKSITGAYGTAISWEVSKDGYNTRTGSLTMPLGGKTMSVSLTAVGSVTPPVTPEQPGTGGDVPSGTVITPEGTDVPKMMPQDSGYVASNAGHVMEYSGYNWEEYDIYVSCRFGTTTAMYAVCVWDKSDKYLGGIWKSTGTATEFKEELLEESDLPSGVTWAQVGKIGLSWSEGKNTPAMKLVKK